MPIYMCAGIVLLLLAFLIWTFLDGVDAILTQGHSVSWWWQWFSSGEERQLRGRHSRFDGLGISRGLPTLLLGIAQVSFVIAVWSIATWSVIWLLSRDRPFLKWIAGIAAIVAVGTAIAAGVLSFAM